jgi:hypothetical protein
VSLVEATIILGVLAVLTAAIAPVAGSYIDEARSTRAAHDVEAIGGAIDTVLRHTGLRCLSMAPTNAASPLASAPCAVANRVELLVSGDSLTANKPSVGTTAYTAPASTTSAGTLNWSGGTNEVADAWKGLMDAHLVTNAAGYTAVGFTGGGGPRAAAGWRGAYLNGPIDLDPWGYAYQANTVFLATASDAADGTGAGQRRGGWNNNVMVVSAGSNGSVQTPFVASTSGATAVGDDIVYVLQGATH